MRTMKTKVVAIIMAVAMVFALGMTSLAATRVNVGQVSVGQVFNEGDEIYNNTRDSWYINGDRYRSGTTYTIPSGKTGTVTALNTWQRSMTITLSDIPGPEPGPTPAATIDYDRITVGDTLNAGDTITNNGHSSPVIVDINEGESSASIPSRGSYTIPDGMTATVTGKSYDWSQRAHILEVTMTAAPSGGDTSGLTPEQRRALSIDAFVENMYIDVLGRNFDSEGRASFIAALNGNEMTGSDVVRAMFNSEEYAARNQTDEEFIATLCQVMAHRAPTDAEIATWTTALASGTTRAQVVDTFLATEEFANVCAFFQVNV